MSYFLLLMLFITPRTFFVSGYDGGSTLLGIGRRGVIAGSMGGASVIGIGGRPLLQKVAVLTVVISLTIASSLSFRIAEYQYHYHYMDSATLTAEVLDSLAIRIVRVISTTFLWLAQVQTLIRLFPRHREKVMIKWIGFALIILETIFTILNNFATTRNQKAYCQAPNVCGTHRAPIDVITPLAYLFELSLSVLYAAWMVFYSICKRRFAFFHPKMRNICLVASLSLVAIAIPIVFFVLDISKPNVSPWGEYIRWLGNAAASVVVWEWVERIEALERDEEKDGILGREVFEDEEGIEETPSREFEWPATDPEGNTRLLHREKLGDSDAPGNDGGGDRGGGSDRQGTNGLANWLDWRRFLAFDPIPEPNEASRRNRSVGPLHRSETGVETAGNSDSVKGRRRGLRFRNIFHPKRRSSLLRQASHNHRNRKPTSQAFRSLSLQSGIQQPAAPDPAAVLTDSPRLSSRVSRPRRYRTVDSTTSSRPSSPASTVYRVRCHSIDGSPPSPNGFDMAHFDDDGADTLSRNAESNEIPMERSETSEGTVIGDESSPPHAFPHHRSIDDHT